MLNDDLRNYEQRLLDYIERGGKFPQMHDKFIERVIDPAAHGLDGNAPTQAPSAAKKEGQP